MKQAEILEIIEKTGSYTAKIQRTGERSIRGLREVQPAQRLEEKGIIKLKSKTSDHKVIEFTWVKNDAE